MSILSKVGGAHQGVTPFQGKETTSGYQYTHGEGFQRTVRKKPGGSERRGEVSPSQSSSSSSSNEAGVTDAVSSPPNPNPSPSQQRAEKEYTEKERRTLIGNGKLLPNTHLEINNTATVKGIGDVLSGLYYIEEVEVIFDSGKGVSKEAVLSKSGFKGSLRAGVAVPPRRKPAKPKKEKKTHTIVRGDTLWALAVKHYGSGTQWRKIFNANNMKTGDERRLQIGRTIVIP